MGEEFKTFAPVMIGAAAGPFVALIFSQSPIAAGVGSAVGAALGGAWIAWKDDRGSDDG